MAPPKLQCLDDPLRSLTEESDAHVASDPGIEASHGIVRRSVVHGHDLEIVEGLSDQRREGVVQVLPTVPDGEQDAHRRRRARGFMHGRR